MRGLSSDIFGLIESETYPGEQSTQGYQQYDHKPAKGFRFDQRFVKPKLVWKNE
jgi:hypothetical protein